MPVWANGGKGIGSETLGLLAQCPRWRLRLALLSERQYSTCEGMPGRGDTDRPVQELHRYQCGAAIDVDGVRTTARAPVENDRDYEQQIGDQGRDNGDLDRGRAEWSGRRQEREKPTGHRRIQKRDAGQKHQSFVRFGLTGGGDGEGEDHREEQNAAE